MSEYAGSERRRRWSRQEIMDRLVAVAALALAGWALVGVQGKADKEISRNVDRLDAQAKRIDAVAFGQCARVQVERERSNVAQATIYVVLKAAAEAQVDPRASRVFADQAAATAWSPPADCERAVADPGGYRLPRTVPFSRLPDGYAERIIQSARRGRRQPLPGG